MKSISKDYIENIVMNHLYNTLFSPKGIENTIKSIRNSALIKNQEIEKDIKEYSVELSGIETKINNITNAIANGMFHSSMKNKLDELETRKSVLNMRLSEAKRESEVMTPSDEIIRAYLLKDSNIKNKSLEEQRLIIQTYVSKIIVNENTIVINTIVSFNGGGEGNRTPVRKPNS